MKLTGLIASSIILASSANAFKNTAPLIFQANNDAPLDQLTYVTKEESLPICSVLSSKKNLVIQIPNLSNQDLIKGQSLLPQVSKLIESKDYKFTPFYKYNDKVEFKCGDDKKLQQIDIESFDDEEWINALQNLDDQTDEIIIFKFPILSNVADERFIELNKVDSYINLISQVTSENDDFQIVVQGLPRVKSANFDMLGALDNLLSRKRRSDEDDIDYEKIKQEVDEAFKEVGELLENESNQLISISGNNNSTDGGLFENYQFFTPGIWMGTIVSFFLLSVLIIAFKWLASLQISYKSFEKQVNLQKKTE